MSESATNTGLRGVVRRNPLQAAKFVAILFSLAVGVSGFFRVVDLSVILDGRLLGDGQFFALLFVPLVSLGLVFLVTVELLVSGVRALRADEPITAQIPGGVGYVLIRGAEAAMAVLGVLVIVATVPILVAESTPAPVGVGIMLLLMAVGVGILGASLVRSAAELFVYSGTG